MIKKQYPTYLILPFFVFLLCFLSFFPKTVSAKKTPQFSKKYHTISIKKTVRFQMKYVPKNAHVTYHISDSSIASIHKFSGKFYAKKLGTVVVSAKIHSKNNTLLTVKKTKVFVKPTADYLKQVRFQSSSSINAFDFSFSLKCSRIVLKSEVQNEKLYLYPNVEKQPVIHAVFSKISSNGKKITYRIPKKYQKNMCPGDASMNQTFFVFSSLFSEKLSVSYEERFTTHSIAGFVLTQAKQPISQAQITLETTDHTLVKTTSDENGYYRFLLGNKQPQSLSVKKNGFYSAVSSSLNFSENAPVAQNFILHSVNSDFAYHFEIKENKNTPLANYRIFLLPSAQSEKIPTSSSDILSLASSPNCVTGETNTDGTLTFSTQKYFTSSAVTNASFYNEWNLSIQESPVTYTDSILFTKNKFVPSEEYIFFVVNPKSDIVFYSHFTPVDFLTNSVLFSITLPQKNTVSLQNLTLHTTTLLSPHHTFLFEFYKKENNSVPIETTLSKNNDIQKKYDIFFTDSVLSASLTDGFYSLRISVLNEKKEKIELSPITKITIRNSHICPVSIRTFLPSYSKIRLYSDSNVTADCTFCFSLYEKTEEQLFYLGDYYSDYFLKQNNTLYTAALILGKLLPDTSYVLYPKSNSTSFFSSLNMSFSPDMLSSSFQGACNNPASFLQKYEPTNSIPQTISVSSEYFYPTTFYDIPNSFIRTADTYPNALLIVYNKQGKILAIHFMTLQQSANNFNMNTKNTSFYDIFRNYQEIVTSQT